MATFLCRHFLSEQSPSCEGDTRHRTGVVAGVSWQFSHRCINLWLSLLNCCLSTLDYHLFRAV